MLRNIEFDKGSLKTIQTLFANGNHPLMKAIGGIIETYGSVDKINARAGAAVEMDHLLGRLEEDKSPYLADIQWLLAQRRQHNFISVADYRKKVCGDQPNAQEIDEAHSVTLEISPLQYFPWLMNQARQALANGEIMPGRFIRLRKMKEQEADGELLAVTAAMQIMGTSWVESPETSGADGANIHLGGPDTLAGYYGGIGAPNDYPIKWLEEILYYYTHYGIREFINVNHGTFLVALMAHRLGVNIGVKLSVTMGHDNPYHILWSLMTAKLFQREDGGTALVGLNFSNSVNSDTIMSSARIRQELGLETRVRFEHHITEPFKGVVRQPYLRRGQLLKIAPHVTNLSAKHEGGEPEVEAAREHPSDHGENFRTKAEVLKAGDMAKMEVNYMDKHDSLNLTAKALTRHGYGFIGAPLLHHVSR